MATKKDTEQSSAGPAVQVDAASVLGASGKLPTFDKSEADAGFILAEANFNLRKIDAILSMTEMGDERPAEFAMELQRLASDTTIDDVLKQLFLRCLPPKIVTAITSSLVGNFEAVAAAADKAWMAAAAAPSAAATVSAVTAPAESSSVAGQPSRV